MEQLPRTRSLLLWIFLELRGVLIQISTLSKKPETPLALRLGGLISAYADVITVFSASSFNMCKPPDIIISGLG